MSISNSVEFRKNIITQLEKVIGKKYGKKIEKGIFNYAISLAKKKNIVRKWENKVFVMLYKNRLRTIFTNLKNDNVKKKIIEKKINIKEFSNMRHQEICPEKWKLLIEAKIKRDKSLTSINLSAATDEFKCYKCKKSKCTYYQLQTRSADEPMTTFVNCLVCGNRWKC